MSKKLFLMLVLVTLMAAACAPAQPQSGLRMMASTTFLADIAQNVAGDRATVESLLPPNADPHAYQPAPADVAKIAESAVLIINGVEYEHFLEPVLENAGGERIVIVASDGLTPLEEGEYHGEAHADESSDEHAAGDPHMWLDPTLVITYVENIRDGLIEADPAGAETYTANAAAYIEELKALDAYVLSQVEKIPAERRLLVTNHEALSYFALRYGFEIVGTVIPSASSDAGTSAQQLATLIEAIKLSNAPAIFLGELENDDFAAQVAAETGARIVEGLHLESLTEGDQAPTYIEMMKHNVDTIVEALK